MLDRWAEIGLATAKQAVEQRAYVIIAGRSQDKLEKTQQFLESESIEIPFTK